MLNKNNIFFSTSAISMNLLTMLSSLLTIRWISPVEMGLWNSYFIFITYVYFIQLGIVNGLSRELPFFLGKNRLNVATSLAKTSLSVVLFNSGFTLVLGLCYIIYLLYNNSYNLEYLCTFVSILVLMIIQFYTNYLQITYRSKDSFIKLSQIYLIQSAFILASLLLVIELGYYGHLIRMPLIGVSLLVLLHIYRPFKIAPVFNITFFKILFKTGAPLFVFNYISLISNTFSRLIILQLGTTLQMGLYSPALAVNTLMRLLPVTLSQYFYPKMSFMAAKPDSENDIWNLAIKISLYMFALFIPLGVVGYFIIPYLIEIYFPRYTEGIFAAQLAVIAGVFSGASISFTTSLNTMKAFKQIGILAIARALIFYVLLFIFANNMNVLSGVAYGVLISELAYFILAVGICKWFYNLQDFKK